MIHCRSVPSIGCEVYHDSEHDVAGRITSLVTEYNVDVHEFYGDSPLVDPQIIDEFIGYYLKNSSGLIIYLMSFYFLSSRIRISLYSSDIIHGISRLSINDSLREHAYNITRFPDKYRLSSISAPSYFRHPDLFLEVDTVEDFEVMSSLIQYFVDKGSEHFSLTQILDFASNHPVLFSQNKFVERRWKKLRNNDTSIY